MHQVWHHRKLTAFLSFLIIAARARDTNGAFLHGNFIWYRQFCYRYVTISGRTPGQKSPNTVASSKNFQRHLAILLESHSPLADCRHDITVRFGHCHKILHYSSGHLSHHHIFTAAPPPPGLIQMRNSVDWPNFTLRVFRWIRKHDGYPASLVLHWSFSVPMNHAIISFQHHEYNAMQPSRFVNSFELRNQNGRQITLQYKLQWFCYYRKTI